MVGAVFVVLELAAAPARRNPIDMALPSQDNPRAAAFGDRLSVTVLCATFNGAGFLPELVASLDAQVHRPRTLVFRDDGSTDATRDVLAALAASRPDVVVETGAHLGVTRGFLALLATHGLSADCTAFADQDDVWLPEKLARATAALATVPDGVPALWCSRATITDAGLKTIGTTPPIVRPAFGNALVENVAIGCTIVLNRAAVLWLADPPVEGILYHDWWCYLVCSAFGRVIADDRPSVLYRQHGGNSVGAPAGRTASLLARLRRGGQLAARRAQALAFLGRYGEALDDERRLLAARFAVGGRRLAFDGDLFRQRRGDDLLLRAALLAGF